MLSACLALLSLVGSSLGICAVGCLKCNTATDKCIVCDTSSGFYLSIDTCVVSNAANCVVMSQDGSCVVCKPGYFADANANSCALVSPSLQIPLCVAYSSNQTCTACATNFYLSARVCQNVTEPVGNCRVHSGPSACSQCSPGFLLSVDYSVCLPSPSATPCLRYTFAKCRSCKNGYLKNQNAYFAGFSNPTFLESVLSSLRGNTPSRWSSVNVCEKITVKNCNVTASATRCTICNLGFFLSNGVCIANPVSPIINCTTYLSNTVCTACQANTILLNSSFCGPIVPIPSCLNYSNTANRTICIVCDVGFYVKDQVCVSRIVSAAVAKCQSYSRETDSCAVCVPGFVLNSDGSACLPAVPNCLQHTPASLVTSVAQCAICASTFTTQIQGALVRCVPGNVTNCQQYFPNSFNCIQCIGGYYLSNGMCLLHAQIADCFTYSATIPNTCISCKTGSFAFQTSSCLVVPTIANCIRYSASGLNCTSCNSGSYLNSGICTANPAAWANCVSFDGTFCDQCDVSSMLNTFNATTDCVVPFEYAVSNCQLTNSVQRGNQTANWIWGSNQPNPIKCLVCARNAIPFSPLYSEAICVPQSQIFMFSIPVLTVANCLRYGLNSLNVLVCMQCNSGFFLSGYLPSSLASSGLRCGACLVGSWFLVIADDLFGYVNICVQIGLSINQLNFPNCNRVARITTFSERTGSPLSNDFMCFQPSSGYGVTFNTNNGFMVKDISVVSFGVARSDFVELTHGFALTTDTSSMFPSVFNYRGLRITGTSLFTTLTNYAANGLANCDLIWNTNAEGTGAALTYAVGLRIISGIQCLRCTFGTSAISIPNPALSLYPSCVAIGGGVCSGSVQLGGLPSYLNAVLSCHVCLSVSGVQKFPTIHMEFGVQGGSIDFNNFFQWAIPGAAGNPSGFMCASAPTSVVTNAIQSLLIAPGVAGGPLQTLSNCAAFGVLTPIGPAPLTVSAFGIINVCLACVSGTFPTYSPTSTINGSPHWTVSLCTAIPNCASGIANGPFNSCLRCSTSANSTVSYAFADLMLTSCVLSATPNCFVLQTVIDPTVPNPCFACMSGYFLNQDGVCEQLSLPSTASNSTFTLSTFLRFYKALDVSVIPNSNFDATFIRLHYLLGFGTLQYGVSGCTSSLYIMAPVSNMAPTLCVISSYLSTGVLSVFFTKYIQNCVAYNATILTGRRVYGCVTCTSGFIPTADQQTCVSAIANCSVAYSQHTSSLCQTCNSGFLNVIGTCIQNTIGNCSVYANTQSFDSPVPLACGKCAPGFYLSSDQTQCVSGNVPNCVQFTDDSSHTCVACRQNSFLLSTIKGAKICFPFDPSFNCLGFALDLTNNDADVNHITCLGCLQNSTTVYGFSAFVLNSTSQRKSQCMPFTPVPNCLTYDQNSTVATKNSFLCLVCGNGFWLDVQNNTCVQRKYSDSSCATYSVLSDDCSSCSPSFFYDGSVKRCVSNPSGLTACTVYKDAETCQQCIAPFYLNGTRCLKSDLEIANCQLYLDNYLCTQCVSGFFLASSFSCVKFNIPNCQEMTFDSICEVCLPGFVLTKNAGSVLCVAARIPNCLVVVGTGKAVCRICFPGYVIAADGTCQLILVSIAGCTSYSNQITCGQCTVPLMLDSEGNRCISEPYADQIDPNCADSALLSAPVCSMCPLGYVFSGDRCVGCSNSTFTQGCMSCDPNNQTVCLICLPGFYQNKNGTCVSPVVNSLITVTPFLEAKETVAIIFCILWVLGSLFN